MTPLSTKSSPAPIGKAARTGYDTLRRKKDDREVVRIGGEETEVICRYVMVTPVKNEERFLGGMISSVLRQTVRPVKWVIVDDNSTDRTGEILGQVTADHAWIMTVKSGDQAVHRKPGGEGVVHCGIRQVNLEEYDFFARLDADITFEADYFERLFREFDKNPRLGIASGVCYVWSKKRLVEEKHPRFHTRGALKTYRIPCYREIGGLERELGWDTVDEIRANMHGWETRSFPELKVIHHRPTQSAFGALKGNRNLGIAGYYVGYHPLFMLARALKRIAHPPYLLGGLSMLFGFLCGYLKSFPRIQDRELIRYVRKQQWDRLVGKSTIWK